MGSSKPEPSDTESDDATKTDTDTEKTQTDEESAPAPGSTPFDVNEKVLAYHNLWLYAAKVRKVEYRMMQWRFFVHYLGWKKNCDEWVGMDRLMKYNDANLKKQQVINKKQAMEKNLKLGRAYMKPRNSNAARGRKRKHESLNKEKGSIPMEQVLSLQIPPALKKQLVDDCEFITHLGKES